MRRQRRDKEETEQTAAFERVKSQGTVTRNDFRDKSSPRRKQGAKNEQQDFIFQPCYVIVRLMTNQGFVTTCPDR